MNTTNIGRNDPCPCGSGKKYKHCCLGGESGNAAKTTLEHLKAAMAGEQFASIEEVQAFTDQFMLRRNQAPREEFCGLSPEQMAALLYEPFDSPHVLYFPGTLAIMPEAPIMTLFNFLAEAVGEKGLKTTAKSNLPRAFCREAAEVYLAKERPDDLRLSLGLGVNKEDDFYPLHVTRLMAEGAGLVRKYKGRFILSRRCRELLRSHGPAGVYPRLLETFATWFNWGYGDGYPELPFIQRSFAFTLYLLSRYGSEERSQTFYEDAFIRAFPMLLDEIEPSAYFDPESELRRCYTLRTLERFAGFLGLATLTPNSSHPIYFEYRLAKTPLLDASVQFFPAAQRSTTF